jgi:hypothetical protein
MAMKKTTTHAVSLLALAAAAAAIVIAGTGAAKKKKNGAPKPFFQDSSQCMACHNGLLGPAGEDISIGTDWRSTMMANSARDPYWQAGVRREVLDHPEAAGAIEGECSICHMPMARFTAHAGGGEGRIFAHLSAGAGAGPMDVLAADGVSCTLCHQIGPDGLGKPESFVGGFEIDTQTLWGKRSLFGPYEVDDGRAEIMSSASLFNPKQAGHMKESGLCGSCHTLYTHALGPGGKTVGRLPEQVPFLEWEHSRYPDTHSCQDCHMPLVEGEVNISSVWGQPREDFLMHRFRGGNFFIPAMLNGLRKDLGTAALPQELAAAAQGTRDHLQSDSARIAIVEAAVRDEVLEVALLVENLAGHKLPTAYPSRRAWIHLTVTDGSGAVLFESGALRPDGSIVENDNDLDPDRYEPHHLTISSADQVQIYEAVLGGPDGAVTTGLLTATRYLKDNRLLPEGFDKPTAHADVASYGSASSDDDFTGGSDRVLYAVPMGSSQGPLKIKVELLYQPIGFRWAMNLSPYKADEPARFVNAYKAAAPASAVVLAADWAVAGTPPGKP